MLSIVGTYSTAITASSTGPTARFQSKTMAAITATKGTTTQNRRMACLVRDIGTSSSGGAGLGDCVILNAVRPAAEYKFGRGFLASAERLRGGPRAASAPSRRRTRACAGR